MQIHAQPMHGIVGGIDLRQQRIVMREAGGAHPLAQAEEIAELRADDLADGLACSRVSVVRSMKGFPGGGQLEYSSMRGGGVQGSLRRGSGRFQRMSRAPARGENSGCGHNRFSENRA